VIATLTLVFGIALLAATAWCPPRLTRVLGSLLFALVVAVVLRFTFGGAAAVVCGVIAGALGLRFLPLLVLRRVVFLVPALVLLIFATTLLMYRAPGNPFANERATSPQVEVALRAQYGVHRGDQHRGLNRLRQISIRAAVETFYLIDRADVAGGNLDDGDIRGVRIRFDAPAGDEAVHVRQIHVKYHHIGMLAIRKRDALLAGLRLERRMSRSFNESPQCITIRCGVVDDQNLGRHEVHDTPRGSALSSKEFVGHHFSFAPAQWNDKSKGRALADSAPAPNRSVQHLYKSATQRVTETNSGSSPNRHTKT